jgi:hypothetical protein
VADPQSDGVTLPTLVMTGGPLDGTTYPLTVTAKELVLGSSMDADVQIMLGNVEPNHASLSLGSRGLAIADGGSATGTYVNGEKVEGAQTLREGDRICLGPPGAKGSAKLLVRLPGGVAPPAEEAPAVAASGPEASPFGEEAVPLVIDDSEQAPLVLEGDPPPPSEPALSAEPPPPTPPASPEADFSGEEILAAEEVIVDDAAVGPPLEAAEVAPEEEGGALFDSPLPPPPPIPSVPAAPPEPAATPEPPPPTAAPEPLTAPPLPTEDYQTELPSIPFQPLDEPAVEPEPPPAPAPPPARAPTRARPAARGRRAGRRSRGPSVPIVPIAGGAIALAAIGAAGWWFFLRPSPQAPAPPPATTAPVESPQAAPPPGTPHVSALEPDVAMPGESILIRGGNLSAPVSVTVDGTAAEVTESTAEAIRVVLPALSGAREGQKTELVVQAGGTTMETMELFIGRSPLVLELDPARGPEGERVVIKGRGFAAEPAGNAVTFGGTPGLVLTASPSELAVVAPVTSTAESPEVPVIVTAGGRASSDRVRYFVTRATTSSFAPRFFAAPVTQYPGEPLAFVSTQLGPVVLLGGPAQSTSTAVRAADASAALSRLVTAARSKKVEIEFRPQPAPSVAVAGEVDPFLVATPGDAAAYSKPWETGSRSGRRMSTRAVAQHWAAVLQDYFGLFLYRERPLQLLSMTPRGKVFMDIYSEARRRSSGGRGIPTSLVYPTSETRAAALSQAALVVSGGAPREEVAVDGTWQGNINDPDTGTRRFRVSLDLQGAGLSGSMRTWRGSIELSSPLRDISFSRGTLRFTADLQGTPHRFEGVLEGETIKGAAEREGRSPAPFTLDYAE